MLQRHHKIEDIKRGLRVDIMFPSLQGDEHCPEVWSWLRCRLHQGHVSFKVECDFVRCENKVETTKGVHLLNLLSENNSKGVHNHIKKTTC